MWKWMSLLSRKNDLLRCWNWLSILKWIGALTVSLLLILTSRKLEPWFVLGSFFLLRLLCVSFNLTYGHAWDTMSGLVDLFASWNCEISYKNTCRTYGLSFAASLQCLAHCQNVASLTLFYRYEFGRCSLELAQLVPHLKGGLLIILIDCIIFLSPFLDIARMSLSTFSFLLQLDPWILCP